jgi:hypothetical protein
VFGALSVDGLNDSQQRDFSLPFELEITRVPNIGWPFADQTFP